MSENEESETDESGRTLDPRVKDEIDNALTEEDIIGMYHGGESGEERIPLIEQFAPDEEEWGGKSYFQPGQPRAITLADNLATAFPVLQPSEEFINAFIEDYEMRLTSLDGVSRDQLMRIFRAMFGAGSEEGMDGENSMRLMLSAGPDNDD